MIHLTKTLRTVTTLLLTLDTNIEAADSDAGDHGGGGDRGNIAPCHHSDDVSPHSPDHRLSSDDCRLCSDDCRLCSNDCRFGCNSAELGPECEDLGTWPVVTPATRPVSPVAAESGQAAPPAAESREPSLVRICNKLRSESGAWAGDEAGPGPRRDAGSGAESEWSVECSENYIANYDQQSWACTARTPAWPAALCYQY